MRILATLVAAVILVVLPTSSDATPTQVHSNSFHHNIDWD